MTRPPPRSTLFPYTTLFRSSRRLPRHRPHEDPHPSRHRRPGSQEHPLMGDRDEITALVHRYAELLDAGDMDAVVAMFAHATWRSAAAGTVLRTPQEIRAVYDRITLYDGVPRTRHLMNNLIIDLVDGADEASGR